MKNFTFIVLALSILVVMSLPKDKTEKIRNKTLSFLTPIWQKKEIATFQDKKEEGRLCLENRLLKDQLNGVYEWLSSEERIQQEVERIKEYSKKTNVDWKDFFLRRSEDLKKILEVELQSIPAKVVFRDPSLWSSSIWINVGEKDNENLDRVIVARNSPVVVGSSLIGVVEFVGKNQSRVRLITDAGLVSSVRAVRGEKQNEQTEKLLNMLTQVLKTREDLFTSNEEQEKILNITNTLKVRCEKNEKNFYLAKGELRGSSSPLWRTSGQILKGIGFNYDFQDEEGPIKDLTIPIISEGDLLITSGLDGVFPKGLDVAICTKIEKRKEGSYYYNIEAKPTALNIDDLEVVFVMPPLDPENPSKP